MKKIFIILLLVLMMAFSMEARAVDFKIKGNWQWGFGVLQKNFVKSIGSHATAADDTFIARQRLRTQLDAVVSENLSGTVYTEIGIMHWGKASQGAALGADGNVVKIRMAYLDWAVPNIDLKVRMGIQNVHMPNKAGHSSILANLDVAGITASYKVNDNLGITALWMRPFNDNYTDASNPDQDNYLDNMDLWALTLPIKFDGYSVTPWVMYGIRGRNVFTGKKIWNDANPIAHLSAYPFNRSANSPYFVGLDTSKTYGSMFWGALPVGITAFDPWNIEFELDYGFVGEMGRYTAKKYGTETVRGSTQRQGWLAKALVEYKTNNWGRIGLFGWYGTGDDGNIKNGSERMPSIRPYGKFTSIFGDDAHFGGALQDQKLTYAGSWALGLQTRDLSFIEGLKHTLRGAWWGGTNSPSMVKYAPNRTAWNSTGDFEGVYLTTQDNMLELNFNSYYQIYENLSSCLALGYVFNMMDPDTWQNGHKYLGSNYGKQDIWKVDLTFSYKF